MSFRPRQAAWLAGWLIVRGSAVTAGLHLIFGSPTSVSVCLWRACDVVRWIRWRGEMWLKAQSVCVLSSVVVLSVSWWRLDVSVVKCFRVRPLHPKQPHQAASLCRFYSANAAAGFQRRSQTPKYDENHMLICFKSLIAAISAEISRATCWKMICARVVLIHRVNADFRALTLNWEVLIYLTGQINQRISQAGITRFLLAGWKSLLTVARTVKKLISVIYF